VWLLWFAVLTIVLGWTKAHWILRIFPVLALIFCVVAAFTVVNKTYDYYPTLARLLGKDRPTSPTCRPAADTQRSPQERKTAHPRRDDRRDHSAHHLQIRGPAGLRLPAPIWFHNPEPSYR